MKKIIIIIAMIIAFLLIGKSSSICSGKINISLNICQFRFNQDTSLVEVYYSFGYRPDSLGQIQALNPPQFLLAINISSDGKKVINNMWKMEDLPAQEASRTSQQFVVDLLKFLLASGEYDVKMVARNLSEADEIDSIEVKNIAVRSFQTKNITMSDIELAQHISSVGTENRDQFYKNQFRVFPNPLSLYDPQNSNVYYYFEIYNLTNNIKQGYFVIKRTIVDHNGLPIPSVPVYSKKKRIRGSDAIEVGTIDVAPLPSGKYFLNFATLDTTGKLFDSSETVFYVYNPDLTPIDRNLLPEEVQMASSEIALVAAEDLEVFIGVTNYFASNEEKKTLNGLATEEAKRLFLYRFWREHDSDKNTPILESFRETMKRIQYANENFKGMKMPGWKSDRGRVLIMYGKPSLIQYYPYVSDFKEFQAWSYDDLERGVVFIFGVIGAFGELKLLHSTKTGEKQNEGWFDLIKVTSGTTGVMDDQDVRINRMETLREIFRRHNLELPRYLK